MSRVTWVVGAGSGMGAAAAIAAARAGRLVVLSGRRTDRLETTAAAIAAFGGSSRIVAGDAREPEWAGGAVADVLADTGRLDEVVIAAGLNAPRRRWEDQSMQEFEAIVTTNLLASTRVIDAALPALRWKGGSVVVISSYAAWTFQPGAGVAYSASKAALRRLTRTLNNQEAGNGVRATHLCPGDVDTDFLRQRPEEPDAAARAVMLSPGDVARSIMHVLNAPAHIRVDELVLSPLAQR